MIINSEIEMTRLGSELASKLQLGDVVFLRGLLGVGKSVLARAIIRALMDDDSLDVPSPSFTLVQEYMTRKSQIIHLDAYRLGGSEDLWELGFPENMTNAITLIEWPERLGALTPARRLDIEIVDMGDDDREIRLNFIGLWAWTILT